ncbi:hypothetical protein ITG09_17925 [Vibrio cyclitrophicus]|nr:hypothetical protein [Vibrio cyclitrophicus]UPR54829.1 hypothetical protein ITG09_17925 [Vibrio cyclitrophicus]
MEKKYLNKLIDQNQETFECLNQQVNGTIIHTDEGYGAVKAVQSHCYETGQAIEVYDTLDSSPNCLKKVDTAINHNRYFEKLQDSKKIQLTIAAALGAVIPNLIPEAFRFNATIALVLYILAFIFLYFRFRKGSNIYQHCKRTSPIANQVEASWTIKEENAVKQSLSCYYLVEDLKTKHPEAEFTTVPVIIKNQLTIEQFILLIRSLPRKGFNLLLFLPRGPSSHASIKCENELMSLINEYYITELAIEPVDEEGLYAIFTDSGITNQVAHQLTTMMQKSYDSAHYVFTRIRNTDQEITIRNLPSLYNPAKNWYEHWQQSRQRSALSLQMLIALSGTCTQDELREFSAHVNWTLPENWTNELQQCQYVFRVGKKFRALSYVRRFFQDLYYTKTELQGDILFEDFHTFLLDMRWKNYRHKDNLSELQFNLNKFAFLIDVFGMDITRKKNKTTDFLKSNHQLREAKCYLDVLEYIATDKRYRIVRECYLRGYKEASLGVTFAIEFASGKMDIPSYSAWLMLLSEILQDIELGQFDLAMEYSLSALDHIQANDSSLRIQDQIEFWKILYSISYNPKSSAFKAKRAGMIEAGLENVRKMLLSDKMMTEAQKQEIKTLYCYFTLLARRYLDRSSKIMALTNAAQDIFEHSFDNIINDYEILYDALPALEVAVRYIDQHPRTEIEFRIAVLNNLERESLLLYRYNFKSADALDIYLLIVRTKAYIYAESDLTNARDAVNFVPRAIKELLVEYEENRESIREHTVIKPRMAYVLMDRLGDTIKMISKNKFETKLDHLLFKDLFNHVTEIIDNHILRHRLSESDCDYLRQTQDAIEYFLNDMDMDEERSFITLLSNDEMTRLKNETEKLLESSDKHKTGRLPRAIHEQQIDQINRLYSKALLLWVNDRVSCFSLFSRALSMKLSHRYYATPDFKSNFASLPALSEQPYTKSVLHAAYQSLRLYRPLKLRSTIYVPCKVIRSSEFGVICQSIQGQKIYVPRLDVGESYFNVQQDFCSPYISLRLNRLGVENAELDQLHPLLVQCIGTFENKIDDFQTSLIEDNPEKAPAFTEFVYGCEAIGTMRGRNFIQFILRNFFTPDLTGNVEFVYGENFWLKNSNSRVLIVVPESYLSFYRTSTLQRLLKAVAGISKLVVISSSEQAPKMADELVSFMDLRETVYNQQENKFVHYSDKNNFKQTSRDFQFVCNVMEEIHDTEYELCKPWHMLNRKKSQFSGQYPQLTAHQTEPLV